MSRYIEMQKRMNLLMLKYSLALAMSNLPVKALLILALAVVIE